MSPVGILDATHPAAARAAAPWMGVYWLFLLPFRLAQVPFALSGPAGTAGTGSWTLPLTVREAFANQTRRYVAEIYDPGAPGGVTRSNTMLITYGP